MTSRSCKSEPPSPAAVQITHSSVTHHISLSGNQGFQSSQGEPNLQSFNVFYASKIGCVLLRVNFHVFCVLCGYFIVLLLVFCKLLQPATCFTLKVTYDVCGTVTSPIDYKHQTLHH